jgi:hypothetical protein
MRPAASIARTRNVCCPGAKSSNVQGEVHGKKPISSREHSNVEPTLEPVNVNVGRVGEGKWRGSPMTVVSGALVS